MHVLNFKGERDIKIKRYKRLNKDSIDMCHKSKEEKNINECRSK